MEEFLLVSIINEEINGEKDDIPALPVYHSMILSVMASQGLMRSSRIEIFSISMSLRL